MQSMTVVKEQHATNSTSPMEMTTATQARIHVDFAGPFMGKMFIVLVDAHTKWMDIHMISSVTTQ